MEHYNHLVIHDNDLDGWMGAAVLSLLSPNTTFANFNYDRTKWSVESLIPLIQKADHVYLVDWSIREGDLLRICEETNGAVMLIDHHQSTKEMLEKLADSNQTPESIVSLVVVSHNTGKCSAELAWDHVCSVLGYKPVPFAVELVGRYDTWRDPFHEDVTAFQAGFYAETRGQSDVERIQFLRKQFLGPHGDECVRNALTRWRVIHEYRLDMMENHWAHGIPISIGSNKGFMCNMPVALLGHAAALYLQAHPEYQFFLGFNFEQERVRLSFRGIPGTGGVNCVKLAELFDGGGHHNAAGARVDVETLHKLMYSYYME